ncbi:MAG: chemotaxis protein CheC [Deltaproteobacteria bacterium]|nr:chemotaxis protein CheC [Candidatus Zymogenaceae bacterium]
MLIDKSRLIEKRSQDALISSALALSQMTGETVNVVRTVVDMIKVGEIADFFGTHDDKITLISLDIHGSISGDIYLMLSSSDTLLITRKIADRWMKEEEIEHFRNSVLAEIGNIVASAYINVLGDSFNVALIPSVPRLEYINSEEVIPRIISKDDSDFALMFFSEFVVGDHGVKVFFFFLLSNTSTQYLGGHTG